MRKQALSLTDKLSYIVYLLAGEIQNGEYSHVRSATDLGKLLPLRPWMKGRFGTRRRISRISLSLDCDHHHLPQVDYCFPQIIGKSVDCSSRTQIGPESQMKFF